jgi:dTMP kinase
LAKAYLDGEYGTDPRAINPYAASTFYAVDRLVSYITDWRADYQRGIPVISSRYTTANAIHQAAKLPHHEIIPFCDWLFDFECAKIGLPYPDAVIYLDMAPEVARTLLTHRKNDDDIHERDDVYRQRCRECGVYVAKHYHWHIIDCAPNGVLRDVNDIHEEIYTITHALFTS